ncbi:MAG: xylS1, partial [Bryobacterales bacterium]|nr:xylS1 [Bryobacterales bacterium]
VGGYDDYPELYTRWFEYGAFQPNSELTAAANTTKSGRTGSRQSQYSRSICGYTLPSFVRAGSIVRTGEQIESIAQAQNIAKVRVYPSADATFALYNDDGYRTPTNPANAP